MAEQLLLNSSSNNHRSSSSINSLNNSNRSMAHLKDSSSNSHRRRLMDKRLVFQVVGECRVVSSTDRLRFREGGDDVVGAREGGPQTRRKEEHGSEGMAERVKRELRCNQANELGEAE